MKHIIRWLILIEFLILLTIAIGGITRLEESGLSMVEWKPLLGIIPPLNNSKWEKTFEKYKAHPEYQKMRPTMTLSQFKTIFFWEYLHRILGRLIGVAFLLPYFFFLIRKKIDRLLAIRLAFILILIAAQGLLGWYMVKSGLVDKPQVSHYRLAAHLLLALFLFSYILWTILRLRKVLQEDQKSTTSKKNLNPNISKAPGKNEQIKTCGLSLSWVRIILILIVLQILYGAFVAGLNAGFIYNTFPSMQGHFFPPGSLSQKPLWINFFNNPVTVQWIHRMLAWGLWGVVIIIWFRANPRTPAIHLLLALTTLQFIWGICVLLLHVPTCVATIHQITACILLGNAIYLLSVCHSNRRTKPYT